MDRMNQQGVTRKASLKNVSLWLCTSKQPWKVFHQPFLPDESSSHGNTITTILRKDWLTTLIWQQHHKRALHATTH